jgi:hypothetical protein
MRWRAALAGGGAPRPPRRSPKGCAHRRRSWCVEMASIGPRRRRRRQQQLGAAPGVGHVRGVRAHGAVSAEAAAFGSGTCVCPTPTISAGRRPAKSPARRALRAARRAPRAAGRRAERPPGRARGGRALRPLPPLHPGPAACGALARTLPNARGQAAGPATRPAAGARAATPPATRAARPPTRRGHGFPRVTRPDPIDTAASQATNPQICPRRSAPDIDTGHIAPPKAPHPTRARQIMGRAPTILLSLLAAGAGERARAPSGARRGPSVHPTPPHLPSPPRPQPRRPSTRRRTLRPPSRRRSAPRSPCPWPPTPTPPPSPSPACPCHSCPRPARGSSSS